MEEKYQTSYSIVINFIHFSSFIRTITLHGTIRIEIYKYMTSYYIQSVAKIMVYI